MMVSDNQVLQQYSSEIIFIAVKFVVNMYLVLVLKVPQKNIENNN